MILTMAFRKHAHQYKMNCAIDHHDMRFISPSISQLSPTILRVVHNISSAQDYDLPWFSRVTR